MADSATVSPRWDGRTFSSPADTGHSPQLVVCRAGERPVLLDPPGAEPSPRRGSGKGPVVLGPAEDGGAAGLAQLAQELARVEQQVNERLDRRNERAARLDRELAARVQDAVDRLDALELRTRQAQAELADLGELQAALDSGLGQLRARIAVPGGVPVASDPGRATPAARRELSERTADANAQLDAVSTATDGLVCDRQRDSARLATLEQAVDRAVAASARASGRARALAPLRSEVSALHAQVVAQKEALDALRQSVDRLR